MGIGSIFTSIRKGWDVIKASSTGKAILGGLGSFFGFEWLTSGGLVDSTSSALGISETTGSLILIVVICLAIYLVFKYLDGRIDSGNRNRGRRS